LKIQGVEDVNAFLNPTINHCEPEDLFNNIDVAAITLKKHLDSDSVIDLIVDPDCDGYSSSAVMYQYLKEIKPNTKVNVYIKSGKVHGLKDVIDSVLNADSALVIIPDAGTGDGKQCTKLYESGREVIILDHHSITPKNNPAIIINNQLSERVTDKAMTGVGVVYKFISYLDRVYKTNSVEKYIDLVAFGMIGDRASMRNLQTRYLVLEGVKQLKSKQRGYNKLLKIMVDKQMYSMNNKVTINGIGFYINPLVNSMIRLGSQEDKEILFRAMCNSNEKLMRKVRGKGEALMSIQEYALRACESTNRKQRTETEKSAEALVEEINKYNLDKLPILVCNAKGDVDSNSTGLIANKLADKYQRPCLLLRSKKNKKNEDVCGGSGRGSDKCEIEDFNKWCTDTKLFTFVEGHPNAFGCEIPTDKTGDLFSLLSKMPSINEPTYHVMGEYEAKDLNLELVRQVGKCDYLWGSDINEPLFYISKVPVNKYNLYLVGKKQNRIEFEYHGIKFVKMTKGSSLAKEYKDIIELSDNLTFTVVGRFGIDYRNGKIPQVLIEDYTYEESKETIGFNFG